MTQEEYIALQRTNIDKALETGQKLLQTSARLHKVCDTADTDATRNDVGKNYLRDTLMMFDFNDAVTDISGMPETLKKFKQQLIDIKIANDNMLLEGGYIKGVDEAISRVFLSHVLCKIKVIDEEILNAVRDALQTLEELKKLF